MWSVHFARRRHAKEVFEAERTSAAAVVTGRIIGAVAGDLQYWVTCMPAAVVVTGRIIGAVAGDLQYWVTCMPAAVVVASRIIGGVAGDLQYWVTCMADLVRRDRTGNKKAGRQRSHHHVDLTLPVHV
jgi:hypothetical protein